MRFYWQIQVLCGTAEPFVMCLSMIGISGSAVAWFHYQSAGAFLTWRSFLRDLHWWISAPLPEPRLWSE